MGLRKALLVALLVAASIAASSIAYTTLAASASSNSASAGSGGQGQGEVLVETLEFPGAVLMGAYKGEKPAVLYSLMVYGPRHTTILAFAFVFTGIAEVQNRTPIAVARPADTAWAHSDFRVIKHDGRPVGLAMGFRNTEPVYIEYKGEASGQSGYYNVSITVVLMAFYCPRLHETVVASYAAEGGNRTLVAYRLNGGVLLVAAFRIADWPGGTEGSRLLVGFSVLLRAAAWLHDDEGEGVRAKVSWVAPFCGSTRPRLQRESGLIRRSFAFKDKAIVREGDGEPKAVKAFCLYAVRGWLLKLAIVVPKADVVRYPAFRA